MRLPQIAFPTSYFFNTCFPRGLLVQLDVCGGTRRNIQFEPPFGYAQGKLRHSGTETHRDKSPELEPQRHKVTKEH